MKKKSIFFTHEVRVGLALLAGVLVVVLAIFSIGEQQGLLAQRYHLFTLMSRVEGLQTGAPVRLAGLRVGAVTSVNFSSDVNDQKIEIEMEIDKDIKPRIRKDSIAHIGTLGLLGDKYIGITLGTIEQPMLEEGDFLQSSDPVNVEKLIDEGVMVFDKLKGTVNTVDEIATKINTGQGTLGKMVNDPNMYFDIDKLFVITSKLVEKIENGEGTMSRLFTDPKLYDNLNFLLTSTKAFVDSLQHGKGTAAKLLTDPKLYDDANTLVQRLTKIMEKLESGQGSLGQMVNDKQLYERLTRLTASMDSLIKDIKLNPKRYLKVEIF